MIVKHIFVRCIIKLICSQHRLTFQQHFNALKCVELALNLNAVQAVEEKQKNGHCTQRES